MQAAVSHERSLALLRARFVLRIDWGIIIMNDGSFLLMAAVAVAAVIVIAGVITAVVLVARKNRK